MKENQLFKHSLVFTGLFIFSSFCLSAVGQGWVNRYNGPGNGGDRTHALAVDDDGNVCVTGESGTSGNDASWDYATVKYGHDGTIKWASRYNGLGNGFDAANAIATDDDGNVYVTGRSPGSGTGSDYATIKYNGKGE